ncbi:hypothetical protein APHAL10511_006436 [Amanita phalloides]|nr:hypothetical protein APHAL10511_006436 [Amanita phalloides]
MTKRESVSIPAALKRLVSIAMVLATVRVSLTLLWLAHIFPAVRGFNLLVGSPGECDPLNVTWSGSGRMVRPSHLLLIPPGGTIRNFSIPASAFNPGSANGSYAIQHLNLPRGAQFMLSMSDTDGTFTGGTSDLMTVGASQKHRDCNTTDPGPDFYYSLDSPLTQCSPYPFTQYKDAVLPIRILVNIPKRQPFVVHPPRTDSCTWIANLSVGTRAAFSVYDAKNRVGGTSSIRIVGHSNNTSCLTAITTITSDPILPPTSSPTDGNPDASPTQSSSNPSPTHSNSNTNTSKGLVIGISIGAWTLLGFATLIGFCCYKQSKLRKARLRPVSPFVDLTYNSSRQTVTFRPDEHGPRLSTAPLTSISVDSISGQGTSRTSKNHISSRGVSIGGSSLYPHQPFPTQLPQTTSQPRNSNRSAQNRDDTGARTTPYPSAVIMHTDISDPPGDPIELPPQYSEYRPPLFHDP